MSEGKASIESLKNKTCFVNSFKSAHGSVYTYDAEGKTIRYKTATKKQHKRQDITVFVDLTPQEEQEFLEAYRHPAKQDKNLKVYIFEKQQDDRLRIIRNIKEITDPNRIYLGIMRDGKVTTTKKAFLTPVVGYNVFDTRYFQENGKWYEERHLGNKITEIEYEPSNRKAIQKYSK